MDKIVMERASIDKKITTATIWSILTEVIVKLISPVTNMILARVLTPEAFGVVATVTMIISFAEIFADAGFQKYVIQHQFIDDIDKNQSYCVAFWSNMCISLFLWCTIFVFSEQLVSAVGSPGIEREMYVSGLLLPIVAISSIQLSIYKKELNFKGIALIRIVEKLIPLIITVPLAFAGLSYWSIIIGNIAGSLSSAIILTVKSSWKPKFFYDFAKLKQMFQFCSWSLMESLSSWGVSNVGIFIIANAFNEYYLGIYKAAITMVMQVTSIITGSTMSVLLSALSRYQNDDTSYKNIYNKYLRILGMFAIPLGFGFFLYKDLIRMVLLGSQWTDADLILGLWGFVLSESVIFNSMSGAVLLSKGHPKQLFISNLLQVLMVIPTYYFSSKYGFTSMVIVSCIVRLQLPITQTIMAIRVSPITGKELWRELKGFLFASLIMSCVAIGIRDRIQSIFLQYVSVIVCALIYFGVLLLIPNERKKIAEIFMSFEVKIQEIVGRKKKKK